MELDVSISKALLSQSILIDFDEHIGLPADIMSNLAIAPGMQVRVARDGYAPIALTARDIPGSSVRMGFTARAKLGGGSDFRVKLSSVVARSWLSDSEASTSAELVERLDLAGNKYLLIAPHGGNNEESADKIAFRIFERLRPRGATFWATLGFDTPWPRTVNAHERWHITSADMSDRSFPYLGMAMSNGPYGHALAIHGHAESYILLGGLANDSYKQAFHDAVKRAFPNVEIRVAEKNAPNSGTARLNMLNRATNMGATSVQFELPRELRLNSWQLFADAIAPVLESL